MGVSVPPVVFEAVLGLVARDDRTPDRRVFQGFGGDRPLSGGRPSGEKQRFLAAGPLADDRAEEVEMRVDFECVTGGDSGVDSCLRRHRQPGNVISLLAGDRLDQEHVPERIELPVD
jgi:hypothetical protein